MTPHDWYVEHREAYVVRALEPREERLFADHLARCAECSREVAAIERELGPLGMGTAPAVPRPGLTRELAESVLQRRSRWRSVLPAAAAAAVAALAVGFGVGERRRSAELAERLDSTRQSLAAVEDTLSIMRGARQVIQRDIAMDGHRGGLLIFQDPVSHRWNVVMHGLPPAPPGEVYQFWFITESGMVRSVELKTGDARPAFATVAMPKVPGPVMGAALTVEPVSNVTPEPRGRELMHVDF
jgi:hypothetical protein